MPAFYLPFHAGTHASIVYQWRGVPLFRANNYYCYCLIFFFVFHKACGTIDLQALLRNGRTPFSTIVWMCILYDVNTVFFLVSLFIFFLNFAVKSRLDEFNAYAPIWYRANFCFTFRAKSKKKKKILYLWLFPAGENLKRLYAHHVTGTHRNGRRYLCG